MKLDLCNHFLRLNIRSWIHFQLGSSAQIFEVVVFEAVLFTFSRMKLPFKLSLKFQSEKVIILRLLRNVKTFVNATSMESWFGIPTFYIGFCYYQLKQWQLPTMWSCVFLFNIESEVLLNLEVVMKSKIVLYQLFLWKIH